MILTETIYIDEKCGLYLEYFQEEGFYSYIHIDRYGCIFFLPQDEQKCPGVKCSYYLDYVSSECLSAMERLTEMNKYPESIETADNTFTADDIPF